MQSEGLKEIVLSVADPDLPRSNGATRKITEVAVGVLFQSNGDF